MPLPSQQVVDGDAPVKGSSVPTLLIGGAIVLLAAALRVAAARGCLWFDEMWSLTLVKSVTSPLGIFTSIHHDNNNHLNSLILFFLGQDRSPFVYRLPAVLFGVGTVLIAGDLGRRGGRVQALIAMLLTACSYLLVNYSSEARGHAPAIFFDFLAFDCLERYLDGRRPGWLAGFWAAATLSLFSHLMFLQVYGAMIVWSLVRLLRTSRNALQGLVQFSFCHVVPVAAILWLYAVDLRKMVIGGGPDYSVGSVLLRALSLAVGGPDNGWQALLAAIGAIVLFFAGLALLRRKGSDLWIFYGMLLIGPFIALQLKRPDVLFVRYFLANIAFALILFSAVFAELFRAGPIARMVALALIGAIVLGNGWHIEKLIRDGRGDYCAMLADMELQTPGDTITVGSDHDRRNGLALDYVARSAGNKTVEYFREDSWPAGGPRWFVVHSIDNVDYVPAFVTAHGIRYHFVKQYPSGSLSGWHLFLYEKAGTAGGSARTPVAWPDFVGALYFKEVAPER
jgi:hypothetical protein